jgi:hypothetical protein
MNGPIAGPQAKEMTMRTTKLRYWMMLSLVAPVLLLSACGDSGSTAPTPVPTPTPISLTSAWSMIGNSTFVFTLSISQVGTTITGTMDSLNTGESNTQIDGAFDGTTITFIRHGASYTQVYTGSVSSNGNKITGTYSHNASASIYPWSATR